MSIFQPKIARQRSKIKRPPTNSKKKKQSVELDSKMLKLCDREFRITMVNMLKACGKKWTVCEQMGNVSREMDHMEMLEMKNSRNE